MLDLARLKRSARRAFAFFGVASAMLLTGCKSCEGRAKRYAAEYGTNLLAEKTNEMISKAEISPPGKTTILSADESANRMEARVTYELPPLWPADAVRPPHAVLLKGIDVVESDGTSGFHMFALYDSKDSMKDIEAFVRSAGASNLVDDVAPEIGATRPRVLKLEKLPTWTGVVFLSEAPEGHSRIGLQVTRDEALAAAVAKAKAKAEAEPVTERAEPVADGDGGGHLSARRFDVMIGKAKFKSGEVSDADRVFASLRPRFKQCFDNGSASGGAHRQSGSIVFRVNVRASGAVGAVDVLESDHMAPDTTACIIRHLHRPEFSPPNSGGAEIELPIWFAPRE